MIIREAVEADSEAVLQLYSTFKGTAYKSDADHSLGRVLADPQAGILVAEYQDALSGLAAFSIRYVVRYPKPIMQLEELFVDATKRRQGVAGQLLAHLETIGRQKNVHAVYIESRSDLKPAHAFYRSCQYHSDGYYFKKIL